MGLYSGGLTTGRIFASENWGGLFSGELIFLGGLIIGILRYYYNELLFRAQNAPIRPMKDFK